MHRKSRNIFVGLTWILVIIALGYGGFVAYERWLGTPTFKATVAEVQQTVGKVFGSTTEWAKNLVRQSAKETAGDVIISASDSLATYGRNIKATLFGDISTTTVPNSHSPAVSISTTVGVPITFSFASGLSYMVDWGDGKKDQGSLSEGGSVSVSHRWFASGFYPVVVSIQKKDQLQKEEIFITVKS